MSEFSFFEKIVSTKKIESDGKGGTFETFVDVPYVYTSHYTKVDGVVNDIHQRATDADFKAHPAEYQAYLDKKAHGTYEDFVKSKEAELKAEFEASKAPVAAPVVAPVAAKPVVKPLVSSAKVKG